MRRSQRLIISGTAAALLAGVSFAAAQGPVREPHGSAPAPNAQSPAPNAQSQERPKAAPAQRPQGQGTPQNRGQTQRGKDSPSTTGQATPGQSEPQRGAPQHKGVESKPKAGEQPAARGQREGNKRDDGTDRQNQRTQTQKGDPKATQKGEPKAQPSQTQTQRGQPGAREPETQGQAGARANISPEQRTQIRETILKMGNAPRVSNVNFTISVGTVVPRTVRLVPLPVAVIEIQPAWRGYLFFLVGDEIIVVDPNSHRIVAVLPA